MAMNWVCNCVRSGVLVTLITGVAAIAALVYPTSPAIAHGGGGGVVYVPIFVPGAAPGLPEPETGDVSAVKTVAVLSAIGQKLTIEHSGFWSNKSKPEDISAWGLDDFAASTVRKYLGSRFAFKDVPYDRAALARIPNGVMDNSTNALKAYLTAIPSAGIDAFIVLRPDLESDVPGDAPGLTLGTGDLGTVGGADYEIDIIDARTLKRIAKAFSRAQLREGQPGFAHFIMSDALKVADDGTITDAQRAIAPIAFERIIGNSVLETLRVLSLGVELPPPGARTLVAVPTARDPFSAIKTVAIVSALGDRLEFWDIGFFSRKERTVPITNWNLDAKVEDVVRSALSKRMAVKPFVLDRGALADMRATDAKGWKDTLDGLPTTSDVDAFLIVLKQTSRLDPWGYDGTGAGVGCGSGGIGGGDITVAYAHYSIVLVDARTHKILTGRVGLNSPKLATEDPVRNVDHSFCAATPAALDQIHQTFNSVVEDSVPETLLRLGLTGTAVAITPPDAHPIAQP